MMLNRDDSINRVSGYMWNCVPHLAKARDAAIVQGLNGRENVIKGIYNLLECMTDKEPAEEVYHKLGDDVIVLVQRYLDANFHPTKEAKDAGKRMAEKVLARKRTPNVRA